MLRPRTDFAALTLDVEGTLIAPWRSPAALYADVAEDHGLWTDPVALESALRDAERAVPWRPDPRDRWDEIVARAFRRPVPAEIRQAIWDAVGRPETWRVLPGAREVAALPVPKAALSNMDTRMYGILAALGLGPLDFVVLSGEAGRPKPHEAMMQMACGFLRVAAGDVLHLGDDEDEDGGLCRRTGATWMRVDPAAGPDPAAVGAAFGLGES